MKITLKYITTILLFFILSISRVNGSYNLIPVSELPNTTGSFIDKDGDMGIVDFIIEQRDVIAEIKYKNNSYYTLFSMSEETDMSIFTDNLETFYYTYKNTPYIVINLSEEYTFFDNNGEWRETFSPHVIWNLETNELQTIDRFSTYIYSQMESGNNAYAYFYVDEFLIDKLLSVSLRYRFKYLNLFNNPTGEWEERGLILEDNVLADAGNVSWQSEYLAYAATGTAIAAAIPGVGLPFVLAGTALSAYLLYLNVKDPGGFVHFGNIYEIEKLNNAAKIIPKLNNIYATQDPTFNGIQEGYSVFKLHLGQFNKPLTRGIEIDKTYSHIEHQEGINVIQFTYMTKGEVYTQKAGNIDIYFSAGPGTTTPPGKNPGDYLTELLIILGLLLLIFGAIRTNAFKNPEAAFKFLLAVGIIALAIYIIYIYAMPGGFKLFNVFKGYLLC